ncbi:secretory calcium-binding phosphoprotein 9 [Thunnus albacares]|uniref:secretory calcium-binding phosphoprotein 9 n=1 Tax=Thunnus albacares TaxID=8236 RepID=UPI001CF63FF1|nr:secretory calcium-binding phosphoprotein 9 [Thunnus albacares]
MRLLLLTTFVATVCYVNAGKKQRMMAALNGGGLLGGMNGGGLLGGMNGGGLLGGMNRGGLGNPGLMAGGLNPPVVAGGGAGLIGQPQFAQFVPGLPAFGAPIPNMFPVPAINMQLPFTGVPQMAPMNPVQQTLMALTGGAGQPPQPDLLQRFRRQLMKQENTLKTTVDTQIPAPPETTTTPCDDDHNN